VAHLPPILARRQNLHGPNLSKLRQHTHAEGGQVEPVLGSALMCDCEAKAIDFM
jgi:hypothetical protein